MKRMLANNEKKLVGLALKDHDSLNLAIQFEIYLPPATGRERRYHRIKGSRIIVTCKSSEDVQRIQKAVRDAVNCP